MRAGSIFCTDSESFFSGCGDLQGLCPAVIQFVILMDRISRPSRGMDSVHDGDLRIIFMLFTD